jgi:hypothetical protein
VPNDTERGWSHFIDFSSKILLSNFTFTLRGWSHFMSVSTNTLSPNDTVNTRGGIYIIYNFYNCI